MSLFETAIGWLAPPVCVGCGAEGLTLCLNCSATKVKPFGERCWRCNAFSPGCQTCQRCHRTSPLNFVWITTDHEGLPRDLTRAYKFGHQRTAARSIAQLMTSTILSFNTSEKLVRKTYLVVPVPTATSRIRERGFGHSELLARKIALKLRLDHMNVLRRLDQTRQLGSKRENRLTQLENSFVIKNPKPIAGRSILLIDDVVTTGGTLIAASKTLRAAGARRVDALLFSKRL